MIWYNFYNGHGKQVCEHIIENNTVQYGKGIAALMDSQLQLFKHHY